MKVLIHGSEIVLGNYERAEFVTPRLLQIPELGVTLDIDEVVDISNVSHEELFWLMTLASDGRQLRNVPYQTDAMIHVAVTQTSRALQYVNDEKITTEVLFAATYKLRMCRYLDEYWTNKFLGCPRVMCDAVEKDGSRIKWASSEMGDHEPLITIATRTFPGAIKYGSSRLRYDPLFCACLAGTYPESIKHFDLAPYFVENYAKRQMKMYWGYYMFLEKMPGTGDGAVRDAVKGYLVKDWTIPNQLSKFLGFRKSEKLKL